MKYLGTKSAGEDLANQDDVGGSIPAYALFQNSASGNTTAIAATELTLALTTEKEDTQNLFSCQPMWSQQRQGQMGENSE